MQKKRTMIWAIQFDADGQQFAGIHTKNGGLHGENKLRCCDCIGGFYGGKMPLRNENSGARLITACHSLDNKKIYFRPDKRNETV